MLQTAVGSLEIKATNAIFCSAKSLLMLSHVQSIDAADGWKSSHQCKILLPRQNSYFTDFDEV